MRTSAADIGAFQLQAAMLVTFVTSLAQIVVGLVGATLQGKSLFPSDTFTRLGMERSIIWLSIGFGVVATIMMTLSTWAASIPGALLAALSALNGFQMIWGRVVDIYFFEKGSWRWRDSSGIGLFLFGLWGLLEFADLTILLTFAPWVVLQFVVSFFFPINQALRKELSDNFGKNFEPEIKKKEQKRYLFIDNFWIGVGTLGTILIAMTVFGGWAHLSLIGTMFGIGTLKIAAITMALVTFSVLGFRGGASIVLKKIMMNASAVLAAGVLDAVFYAEAPFGWWTAIGLVFWSVSWICFDDKAWNYFVDKKRLKEA